LAIIFVGFRELLAEFFVTIKQSKHNLGLMKQIDFALHHVEGMI
jgi:hypothetical protein